DIVLVAFIVKAAYATRLGAWSAAHYGVFARNFWALGKHLLDLPLKLALPLLLWCAFYLPDLSTAFAPAAPAATAGSGRSKAAPPPPARAGRPRHRRAPPPAALPRLPHGRHRLVAVCPPPTKSGSLLWRGTPGIAVGAGGPLSLNGMERIAVYAESRVPGDLR